MIVGILTFLLACAALGAVMYAFTYACLLGYGLCLCVSDYVRAKLRA